MIEDLLYEIVSNYFLISLKKLFLRRINYFFNNKKRKTFESIFK